MSDGGAAEDFLSQMHVAVLEECPLYEAAAGSVDLLAGGPVIHGPWAVERVAQVLRRWHDAGWIGLYLPEFTSAWNIAPAEWQQRLQPDGTLLPADATDLLNRPDRWTIGRADGHVSVYQSDRGEAIAIEQWFELAAADADLSSEDC